MGESYDLGEDLKELALRTSHSSHAPDIFVSDGFYYPASLLFLGRLATALQGHNVIPEYTLCEML
ncbi:MAG: hypothetical protein A2W73_09600 [Deltaproteobacteria bacterium RIFCSPLOWO2_12_55_13]|nr:MAG: hypothetical protein A2W73_09600 [Deltaproteobacteria bacterium RIFCSPLOWO2_12_55_13]